MTFTYKPLLEIIEKQGISINQLYEQGVITDHSANNIRKGRPVSISAIANICRYLNVSIDQVVEIIPKAESP